MSSFKRTFAGMLPKYIAGAFAFVILIVVALTLLITTYGLPIAIWSYSFGAYDLNRMPMWVLVIQLLWSIAYLGVVVAAVEAWEKTK